MWSALRILVHNPLLANFFKPLLRPLTRFIIGMIAVPLFRLFLKKVVRLQDLDAELEKDFEQWFRGSLLLLCATRNMEALLFPWVSEEYQSQGERYWVMVGLRLLLAVGVIEAMPDQELFAVIHPGPPRVRLSKKQGYWRGIRENFWPVTKGLMCQHLNRSSPVFAILAAIAPGTIGWTCFVIAIVQYLIIGLVTSRDKALNVLSEFDRQVAIRRRELVEEFEIVDVRENSEPVQAVDGPDADCEQAVESKESVAPPRDDQLAAESGQKD